MFGFGGESFRGDGEGGAGVPATPFGTSYFGAPPTTVNSGTFGAAPVSFGASFGGGTHRNETSFGSSPNVVTGPFGQPTAVSGFGDSSSFTAAGLDGSFPSGFGSGFGGSFNTVNSGDGRPGRDKGKGQGFGNQSNTPQATFGSNFVTSNPFGASSGGSVATVAFGTSSNVVTATQSLGYSPPSKNAWGSQTGPQIFGSNPFGGSTNDPSVSNDTGMQQQSDNEDMADGSTSPFGFPKYSSNPYGDRVRGGLSRVDEEVPMTGSSSPTPQTRESAVQEQRIKDNMEEKKRLQAKIEEKKKKLLERKLKKTQSKETSLSADATPFFPASDASLAERNSTRFAQHLGSTSYPKDQVAADSMGQVQDSQPNDKGDRKILENAVSLVGNCQNMCPDDELARREREGDIQQLEIVQPGTLHPAHWTLRDTSIKRFRRSAADYKLDVADWVRPASVLERTVSYIEEWVMERDRQGPDPRFPQGQSPPALDVYQFVWDRTRMIRKDFTLQNYVGTGGNCDAPAVRCHERIARWHAMCEHQLSHLSDFTTMQSTQNIQELMQTMQSLNQFYDDSLNRSTVEVPDKYGNELQSKQVALLHGCSHDCVQGNCPMDYDGSVLQGTVEERTAKFRLIGNRSVDQPKHGTAEPELRGMYILLTMNTDGGMEVLKYAAKLFQERPRVYHSKPVQLALSVYKAKREYNYARFFSILKSPSTPYLFSCLMFKHVELMRKAAFRIMSKTFGARKKETGEAIYDAYPLSRLVDLLCFESLDEARAACKHYNIAVKEMKMTSSSDPSRSGIADIIFWRHSDFKEPKNPTKGTIIPLQPWKMIKTIERKLNGATRLAVCRGDASGDGATLVDNVSRVSPLGAGSSEGQVPSHDATSVIKIAPPANRQKPEQARLETEARMKEEENEARRLQEKEKALAQRKAAELQLISEKQKEHEDKKKRAIEEQQHLAELERQRLAEEERLQLERKQKWEQERRLKIEAEARAAAELQRQKKSEERRQRLEEEAANRAKEAELASRQAAERREIELKQQRAEALKIKQEEERARREAEEAREKVIKLQEGIRKRKEAEEKMKKKEWQTLVDSARRKIVWLRWRCIVGRRLEMASASRVCLRDIDPTFLNRDSVLAAQFRRAVPEYVPDRQAYDSSCVDARRVFERLLKKQGPDLNLAGMAIHELQSPALLRRPSHGMGRAKTEKSTLLLLKLCVTVPGAATVQEESIRDLAMAWVSSRLKCGRVVVEKLTAGKSPPIEVRAVVASSPQTLVDADMELVLLPPPWTTLSQDGGWIQPESSPRDGKVPCLALVLGKNPHSQEFTASSAQEVVAEGIGRSRAFSTVYPSSLSEDAFECALVVACKKLVKKFVEGTLVYVDRILPGDMGTIVMREALWAASRIEPFHNGNSIVAYARYSLLAMAAELEKVHRVNEIKWKKWPPSDFADEESVPNYFSKDGRLPLLWGDHLSTKSVDANIGKFLLTLDGTFRDVIERLLVRAPKSIHEECAAMTRRRQFRRCFERALLWNQEHRDPRPGDTFFYFPRGLLELIVQNTLATLRQDGGSTVIDEGYNYVESASTDDLNAFDVGDVNARDEAKPPQNEHHNLIPRFPAPGSQLKGCGSSHIPERPGKRNFAVISVQSDTAEGRSMAIEKRPRSALRSQLSLYQRDSLEFTMKLESFLRGDTVDMLVGRTTLAQLLCDVPKLDFEP